MIRLSHYKYHMPRTSRRWQSCNILPAICLSILFLLPFGINSARLHQERQAAALAPHVLRFHVLANSDTPADQQLKLEIREVLLEAIYAAFSGEDSGESSSKEALLSYIQENTHELEQKAEQYMQRRGFDYPARIEIARSYFPTKQYGDMTFPSGTYDAVRVLIGEGNGRNWWCVLYPPLCFSGAVSEAEMHGTGSAGASSAGTSNAGASGTEASLPDASKKTIQALVPDTDYAWMRAKRNLVFGDGETGSTTAASSDEQIENTTDTVTVHVRFQIMEFLQK